MKIEQITQSKIKQLSNSGLFSLRLRAIQLYEKYSELERKEPLVDVDWDSFLKRYKLLTKELSDRNLSFTRRKMDKILEMEKRFGIKVLGAYAQIHSPLGKHFSLLVQIGKNNILIDPALAKEQVKEDLSGIIITQADKDHWGYLKYYPKEVPIYTSGKILDNLPFKGKHLFIKSLKIGASGVLIRPVKVTHKGKTISIGVRLEKGDTKVSIIPEFLTLSKASKGLIEETIWICGVGNYKEDDEEAGKLSFLSLMELAKELKPKKIFLTNLREDLLGYKDEVELELKKWQGRILYDDDILEEDEIIRGLKWGLNEPEYETSSLINLKKIPHFDKGEVIVEADFNGVRVRVEKKEGDIMIMTNPEKVEGSPLKTKELALQSEELKNFRDDFVGDARVCIVDKDEDECLGQKAINSYLDSKDDLTEMSKKVHVFISDLLEINGKDISNWTLERRKEALSKFRDTEHIHFVRSIVGLEKKALSYIVDVEKENEVEEAINKITDFAGKDKFYPRFIAKGVVVKLYDAPYKTPQSPSLVKITISKPETTENYHRIPVTDCKITATITISEDKGIKALYCGNVKKIATFLFDINKWTMAEAKAWVKKQTAKSIEKMLEIEEFCKASVNSPIFAYHAVYGKFPDPPLTGRTNMPKRMWNGVEVDKHLKDKWLEELNSIPEIEIRSSDEGKSKERVAYIVFRMRDPKDDCKIQNISEKLNEIEGLYSEINIGKEKRLRAVVAGKVKYGDENWEKWWSNLAGKIKGVIREEFEKIIKYDCECLNCGFEMESDKHCNVIKCPKCGGQMRRAERPGPGQKSEGLEKDDKVQVRFDFKKIDSPEFIVGGVVYPSNKVDSQGHFARQGEVWDALKKYMINKRNIKIMHKGNRRNIPIIESYFVEEGHHKGGRSDKYLIEKGDWWIAVYLGDAENKDIWADVKSGKLTGFSMAGRAHEQEAYI